MLNHKQVQFFAAFSGFTPRHDASADIEFNRLAEVRKWRAGSKTYRRHYRALNEEHSLAAINVNTRVSTILSSNRQDASQYTQDNEHLLGALAHSLARLQVASSPSSTSPIATPESSADEDEGVQVRYFDSFEGFTPNNGAPIKQEFERLAAHQGWKNKVYLRQSIRCYGEELKHFIDDAQTQLQVLQGLCMDLRIDPIPLSVNQCKKVMSPIFVNIYDYLDCKRAGTPIMPVFKSCYALKKYCIQHEKIFPKKAAKLHKYNKVLLKSFFHQRH